MDELQRRIQIARGAIPADLVLLNAKLVNVCSGECYPADVAIADGHHACAFRVCKNRDTTRDYQCYARPA